MSSLERDPKKRRVKPVESSILDFDLEESSDDSDFRIEDHADQSDDDCSSEENEYEDETDASLCPSEPYDESVYRDVSQPNIKKSNIKFDEKDANVLICCGCLGDQSDGVNEIAECDGCGVTVHEACYGIADSNSVASTDSLSPTTPWFCEACRAGVMNPTCELCPNSGGIFKETDVGKWVHLVCALYVPGVAFGEVDKLSSVTLFEMQYNKWGAKMCTLCLDERYARTGVCIGCDAGMCRNYFHVTCAQREGFLSEAHSEEVDQADPFYAHCKLHSDKTLVKRRKRNYMSLEMRNHFRKMQFAQEGHSETPEQLRIQKKLERKRMHYLNLKSLKTPPWVPTQKMPRLLTTSASACKRLMRKAELMGIDTVALEMQETQMAALTDIRKKWHIPPAFTVEFIAYYLDRNDRLKGMKGSLDTLLEDNYNLLEDQQKLRTRYDELLKESTDNQKANIDLKQSIEKLHSAILSACPNKNLPNVEDLGKVPPPRVAPQAMSVPTAAALKMGVGFPLNNIPANRNDAGRVLSSQARQDPIVLNECGICRHRTDQHMMAKCDTCHLYYHLQCLNPPLTRLPKKSKLYGWQCSECDKTSDSEMEEMKTPRRSRTRHSKEGRFEDHIPDELSPTVKIKPVECFDAAPDSSVAPLTSDYLTPMETEPSTHVDSSFNTSTVDSIPIEGQLLVISRSGKKRRRDKHRNRYSPEFGGQVREHKRKRKKKSLDLESSTPHPRITIKIKPIPMPAGEVATTDNPQCFYVNNESNDAPPPAPSPPLIPLSPPRPVRAPQTQTQNSSNSSKITCDVCQQEGIPSNVVKCDDCQKNYHFTCLEPPVKKTPKRRGYSWHCADCDPTGSE